MNKVSQYVKLNIISIIVIIHGIVHLYLAYRFNWVCDGERFAEMGLLFVLYHEVSLGLAVISIVFLQRIRNKKTIKS